MIQTADRVTHSISSKVISERTCVNVRILTISSGASPPAVSLPAVASAVPSPCCCCSSCCCCSAALDRMSATPPSMSTALLLSECMSSTTVLSARSIRDIPALCGLLFAGCVTLCGDLMLWCLRCVLSFKMGFWVCGSGGVRDVHVLICTRVVQIGVATVPRFCLVLSTSSS